MSDTCNQCTATPLTEAEQDPGKAVSLFYTQSCEVTATVVTATASIIYVNGAPTSVIN